MHNGSSTWPILGAEVGRTRRLPGSSALDRRCVHVESWMLHTRNELHHIKSPSVLLVSWLNFKRRAELALARSSLTCLRLSMRLGRERERYLRQNKTFASSTTQNPGAYTKRISGEGSAGLGYTKRRAEVAVSKTTKEARRSE